MHDLWLSTTLVCSQTPHLLMLASLHICSPEALSAHRLCTLMASPHPDVKPVPCLHLQERERVQHGCHVLRRHLRVCVD